MGSGDIDEFRLEPEYFTCEELKLLYENRQLLERVMRPKRLMEILYTLSGEKPCYFSSIPVLTEEAAKGLDELEEWEYSSSCWFPEDLSRVKALFDEFGAVYAERKEFDDRTYRYHWKLLLSMDGDILTEAIQDQFEADELDHGDYGRLLGYPEESVDTYVAGDTVDRQERIEGYYQAVLELGVDGLPYVWCEPQLPIVFLKAYLAPMARPGHFLESYKWSVVTYCDWVKFSKKMEKVLDSRHIMNWDLCNPNNHLRISNPVIEDTLLSERFKELQERFVVNEEV